MTRTELQTIFEAHKDAVYGFAWRMTGSQVTAEDIAQECFLQVLKTPGAASRLEVITYFLPS